MKHLVLPIALLALLPGCDRIMKKEEACPPTADVAVVEDIEVEEGDETGADTADSETEDEEEAGDEAQEKADKA